MTVCEGESVCVCVLGVEKREVVEIRCMRGEGAWMKESEAERGTTCRAAILSICISPRSTEPEKKSVKLLADMCLTRCVRLATNLR